MGRRLKCLAALISATAAVSFAAAPALGAPANDDFANAIALGPALPASTSIDETGATSGADDPTCLGHDATVWFSFTPTADTKVVASTAGSNYSTALSVWTGNRGSLQYVACSNPFDGRNAPVTFRATAGVTYHIMVGTFGGGPGSLSLSLSAAPPPPPPPTTGTFLYYASDRGDYIGQGETRTLTPDDFDFFSTFQDGFFRAFVSPHVFVNDFWSVDIAAPPGEELLPGTYLGATRASFRAEGEPGLDVSGAGAGCNTLTGRFTVNRLVLDSAGEIRLFDADFEQHCEGANPALIGKIRIENGPVDETPPVVTCSANPRTLWPPNHKLVPITVDVSVEDGDSGPAGYTLESVVANEPAATGDVSGFSIGTADTTGALRATRGARSGRVYTLTYVGKDNAGNTASCSTTVTVPHDNAKAGRT
jgi:hypothetical protein